MWKNEYNDDVDERQGKFIAVIVSHRYVVILSSLLAQRETESMHKR